MLHAGQVTIITVPCSDQCLPSPTDFKLALKSNSSIQQLLLNRSCARLLVSYSDKDELWNLKKKTIIATVTTVSSAGSRSKRKWFNRPNDPKQLVRLREGGLTVYNWKNLKVVGHEAAPEIRRDSIKMDALDVDNAFILEPQGWLVIRISSHQMNPATVDTARLFRIDLEGLSSKRDSIIATPLFADSSTSHVPEVELLLGMVEIHGQKRAVFLTTSGWVCSAAMDARMPLESSLRHFVMPRTWLSRSSTICPRITAQQALLFVHDDQIALIEGGFAEVEETQETTSATTVEATSEGGSRFKILRHDHGPHLPGHSISGPNTQ